MSREEGLTYDCVVVGAGPNGLAMLSRLHQSRYRQELRFRGHSHKTHSKAARKLRVAVVDESGEWLSRWRETFSRLQIQYLRSPLGAHVDFADEEALLAAVQGQAKDWRRPDVVDRRRGEDWNALLGQPSVEAFLGFAAMTASGLEHEMVRGRVTAVHRKASEKKKVEVVLEDGRRLTADHVVLALGYGTPIMPPVFSGIPEVMHSSELPMDGCAWAGRRVLVVGGGSSAALAALVAAEGGAEVDLCSRRPVTVQAFELAAGWLDPATAGRLRFEFYAAPTKLRLELIRRHRLASMSPADIAAVDGQPRIRRRVAAVRKVYRTDQGRIGVLDSTGRRNEYDRVVCATGYRQAVAAHPLLVQLMKDFPISTSGGYPLLTRQLRWRRDVPVYCLGAPAALAEGPEVFSMVGLRRCVSLVGADIAPAPADIQGGIYDVLAA